MYECEFDKMKPKKHVSNLAIYLIFIRNITEYCSKNATIFTPKSICRCRMY